MEGIDKAFPGVVALDGASLHVAAGEVHLMFDGLPSLIGQIKAGRLRPLAAMTQKRFAIFPEVPTAAEAGLAGMEGGVWYGLSGPVCIAFNCPRKRSPTLPIDWRGRLSPPWGRALS